MMFPAEMAVLAREIRRSVSAWPSRLQHRFQKIVEASSAKEAVWIRDADRRILASKQAHARARTHEFMHARTHAERAKYGSHAERFKCGCGGSGGGCGRGQGPKVRMPVRGFPSCAGAMCTVVDLIVASRQVPGGLGEALHRQDPGADRRADLSRVQVGACKD